MISENDFQINDSPINDLEKREEEKLFRYHYTKLSESCRKLLNLSFENLSAKEIAQKMGYKTDEYARRRKYQCKQILMKKIMNDPKYRELVK